uniref:Uncharacterized protein n=1 Tax=Plectus sambesii TaxID=2011161 RepID=A0A914XC74_9BILA
MLRRHHNVRLPPLIIDGEPKAFLTMGTRDLQLCVTLALKASYGFPLTTSGFRFRSHARPDWWPDDLDWSIHYIDAILPVEDRSKHIRDLLRLCYRYYHQEETLFLFDVNPGQLPLWHTVHDADGWKIASLETGAEIWRFASPYQVTSLCALEARLIEEHNQLSSKSGSLLRLSPKNAIAKPTTTKSKLTASNAADVACERTICDGKSRVTRLETAFGGMLEGPVVRATPVECRTCKQQFALDVELAAHLISCSVITRNQMEKNSLLFRLGLVPKAVNSVLSTERVGRTLTCDRKLRRFGGSFRGEITSELGRLLFAREDAGLKSVALALKADRDCMGAVVTNGRRVRQAAIIAGNIFAQNVYRPIPGLKKNKIWLKFNGAERRFAARQRQLLKRKAKEWCVPVQVVVQRLTDAELVKYAPTASSSSSSIEHAGVKNLRVVIEQMTPEDELALLVGSDPSAAEHCLRTKVMPASEISERSTTTTGVIARKGLHSTPSPRNRHTSCTRRAAFNDSPMDTSKALSSNIATLKKSNGSNAKAFGAEKSVSPLFPSRKFDRPAAFATPLNHRRSSLRPNKSPMSATNSEQSTLFFCRLCGFEQLYEEKARGSIQHHVSVHVDLPIVYRRLHHTIAGVRLLVVEAVQDECIGAINTK